MSLEATNQMNCHQPAQVKMNLRQIQVRKVHLKVQAQMIKHLFISIRIKYHQKGHAFLYNFELKHFFIKSFFVRVNSV